MKPCRKRLYRHCSALYVCQQPVQEPAGTPGEQVFDGQPRLCLQYVRNVFNLDKTALSLPRRAPPRYLDGLVKDQACQRKSVTKRKRVSPTTPVLRQLGQKTIDLGRVAA